MRKKVPSLKTHIEMTKLCTSINLLVPSSFCVYSLLFLSFLSILTTGVLIDRYHLGRFSGLFGFFSTILASVAFDDVMTGFL